MGLKIVPAGTPYDVKRLVTCLYGDPGAGKTTTALGAETPLLLDCDQGAARAVTRTPPARIDPTDWSDIAGLPGSAEFAPFKTIILDTVGSALDLLFNHLAATDRKLSTTAGAPSRSGWGALKARFTRWLARVMASDKDVILLCHSKEVESQEQMAVRLDVAGGSKDLIYRVSHVMGYIATRGNNKRMLYLDPTESWHGKNPGREPSPTLLEPTGSQMAEILARAKDSIPKNVISAADSPSEMEAIAERQTRDDGFTRLVPDDAKPLYRSESPDNGGAEPVTEQNMDDVMARMEKKSILEEHNQKLKNLKNGNDREAKRKLWQSAASHGFKFDKQAMVFTL